MVGQLKTLQERKNLKDLFCFVDTFAVIAKSSEGDDGIHCDLDELTQRGSCATLMRNEI